jgi:hypothetical protein
VTEKEQNLIKYEFPDLSSINSKKACKYVLQYNVSEVVLLGATQGIGNLILTTPLIRALTSMDLTVHLLNYGFNNGAEKVLEDMMNVEIVTKEKAEQTTYLLGLQTVWPHIDVEKYVSQVRLCGNIQDVWKDGLPAHEVELNMSLAYSLKYQGEVPELYCKWNKVRNPAYKHKGDLKFVGIHVCTRYNHQFYANRALHEPIEIAKELEKQGYKPVVFGLEGAEGNKDDWPVTTCFMTGMELADTAGAIREMDCMINEDSGIMHVTAAMDVKQVAIFGPTSQVKNRPWSKKAVVLSKSLDCQPCQYGPMASTCTNNRCMEISAKETVSHVNKLIERF